MNKLVLLLSSLFAFCSLFAQTYTPDWKSLDSRKIPTWFQDGKFGIFIHWGVYSVPAWSPKGNYSEWYQHHYNRKSFNGAVVDYHHKVYGTDFSYYQFGPLFKAELFNPDEWAQLFERSGAKYIVLTSKHHDGYALWPSKHASSTWGFPWNATEVGPKRDLLGDLFKAVRKTSVRPGMYYSLYEWFNPLWLADRKKYVDQHMWPQMKDLINTYEPDVFWTDGEWDAPDTVWKSKEFLTWLFNESPVKGSVVVNDRWGAGIRFNHGGVFTPEYQPDLDFEDHYFEESRGMGFSYGYNREEDAWDYNSPQVMILHLIDKISRGGNFLLDIGPDGHGKIPPIMQERLMQIGKWMSINGEAIYGSRRWKTPFQWSEGRRDYKMPSQHMVDDWKTGGDIVLKLTVDPDPGYAVKESFFTYNPSTKNLYVILPKWHRSFRIRDLQLPAGTKIQLLETNTDLPWSQNGNDIELTLPEFEPGKMKSEYAYVIRINGHADFAAKPSVNVTYPSSSLKPLITISNRDNNVATYYTIDGTEPTPNANRYSKPFTVDKDMTVKVKNFREGVQASALVEVAVNTYKWNPSSKVKNPSRGLQYKVFESSMNSVRELEQEPFRKSGVTPSISLRDTTRREQVGISFNGFINIPADDIYTFYLSSDDGSKLWIDDKEIIDLDGLHSREEKHASVALRKGMHKIKVNYFQATGGAVLRLSWSSERIRKQEIPAENYYFLR